MIVIRRDGQTTVLTGWRAWLAGAGAFVLGAAVLWVVLFVMLGLAITIGTILLIAVPIIVAVAIVVSLFQSRSAR
jgi:hypothetical protein